MFFILAVLATLGYSLQSTLMASYYRSMDCLSAVAFRGISLGISMLPLMLFVSGHDLLRTPAFVPLISIASVLAALGNWSAANAYRQLPVGITSALSMSATSLVVVVIGWSFLGELLSATQLLLICLIMAGGILLGASRSAGTIPADYNAAWGVFNCLMCGLFLGISFALIGTVSRLLQPFIAGYLWEFIIGLAAASVAMARGRLGGAGLSSISLNDFTRVLLFSSPTVLGTGCYALAMTMGPISITTAITNIMMVFSTLLAYFIYDEKLTTLQWVLLFAICSMVVGLRLST